MNTNSNEKFLFKIFRQTIEPYKQIGNQKFTVSWGQPAYVLRTYYKSKRYDPLKTNNEILLLTNSEITK